MMVSSPSRVAGVLLAAGLSTRMGQPKQLVPLAGRPLCRYAAEALAGAGHAPLLAVIPPGEVGEGIRAALHGLPFDFAVNPDPARGLASSFRVAVQALPAGLAAVNFALADMPLVTAEVHRALLDAFQGAARPVLGCGCEDHEHQEGQSDDVPAGHSPGVPLVLAEYGQATDAVRAPPHLFRADLLRAVLDAPDADQGPRHLIRQYAEQGLVVRFPAALLLDVDTPAALAQAEAQLNRR